MVKIIKTLYGESGGLTPISRRSLGGGVWTRIVESISQLHETEIVAKSIRRVLGNARRRGFGGMFGVRIRGWMCFFLGFLPW